MRFKESGGYPKNEPSSKFGVVKAAKLTGDIPQNVNFGINGNFLPSFFDANSMCGSEPDHRTKKLKFQLR
jgi:hypothetical protein